MTQQVHVTAMEPGVFGVQVTEGDTTTSHRVTVSENVLSSVATDTEDQSVQEAVVRESFDFLLEREPATEILSEFSLDEIPHYFPEYPEELSARIANR